MAKMSVRHLSSPTGIACLLSLLICLLLTAPSAMGQQAGAPASSGGATTSSGGTSAGGTGAVAAPGAPAAGAPVAPAAPAPAAAPIVAAPALGLPPGMAGALSSAAAGNPAAVAAVGQQLGLSPDQITNLRGQLTSGTVSLDMVQQLSARLGAMNLSDSDLATVARSLGINDPQLIQIRQAITAARGQQPPNPQQPQAQNPSAMAGLQGAPTAAQASAIEAKFQQLDNPSQVPSNPSAAGLTQFGYSLFSAPVSTFAPVGNVPVGDDYIVGPGDQLLVLLWGRVNTTLALTVARDGTIEMDQIGPLQVGGLTFGQAKKLIESRGSQMTGVQVNVTMGQLRTIQVFVVGEVEQPGAYTISALSRVSNALVAAGAIKKIGSLRKVQLRRGNQLVRVIDLYNVLLRGDTSADERLQQDDVIFVPVIGKVTAVAGDVKRAAIYELNQKPEDLNGVLKLAGGVNAFGYSERIQIERVENHKRMIALDINLDQLGERYYEVRDGDVIKVFQVLPEQQNVVVLSGNVHRPGNYQWHPGIKVSELVREGEGVLPHTFFKYALLKRLEGPQKYIHFQQVDLGAAFSGNPLDPADISLRAMDELVVYSQDALRDLPQVTVAGEARSPGSYVLSERMKISDLIYLAGGLKDDAFKEKAELARTEVVNGAQTRHSYIDIDLRKALAGSPEYDLPLHDNDQIFIRTASNWHLPWVVTIIGRVLRPGPYTVHESERLSSVLMRCGGFLPDAFPEGVVFTRSAVKVVEQQRLDEARQRLSQDLALFTLGSPLPTQAGQSDTAAATIAGLQRMLSMAQSQQADGRMVVHIGQLNKLEQSPENVVLEDGDAISIPRRPASVNVLGQVYYPTSIVALPSLTVRDYLYRAGGPTLQGDMDSLLIIKADGSVLTQQGLSSAGKGSIFPMLPLLSGGLISMRLAAGDTVYVPEDVQSYIKLQHAKDVTTIVSQSAQSLAILGLLATKL